MIKGTQQALTSYFQEGDVWEHEIIKRANRSARVAWSAALVLAGLAALALLAIVLLLPLKSFEPYIVTVDRTTGYIEVQSGLTRPSKLTEQQAGLGLRRARKHGQRDDAKRHVRNEPFQSLRDVRIRRRPSTPRTVRTSTGCRFGRTRRTALESAGHEIGQAQDIKGSIDQNTQLQVQTGLTLNEMIGVLNAGVQSLHAENQRKLTDISNTRKALQYE